MTTIKMICTGAYAVTSCDGTVTEGMVGLRFVSESNTEWDDLTPHYYARCNGMQKELLPEADGSYTIPWEILKAPKMLEVGAEGVSEDGTTRIPTIWAQAAFVQHGSASPCTPAPPPSPTLIEQLLTISHKIYIKACEAIETAKEALAAAKEVLPFTQRAEQAAVAAEASANTAERMKKSTQDDAVRASSAATAAISAKTDAVSARDRALAFAESARSYRDTSATKAAEAGASATAAEASAGRAEAAENMATGAIDAVKAESAAQQRIIRQTGAEVLDTIPADYTALSADMAEHNSADLIRAFVLHEDKPDSNGIDYTYDAATDEWHITGETGKKSGTLSWVDLIKTRTLAGIGLVPGKRYFLRFEPDGTPDLAVSFNTGATQDALNRDWVYGSRYVDVPADAVYLQLQLAVRGPAGVPIDTRVKMPALLTAPDPESIREEMRQTQEALDQATASVSEAVGNILADGRARIKITTDAGRRNTDTSIPVEGGRTYYIRKLLKSAYFYNVYIPADVSTVAKLKGNTDYVEFSPTVSGKLRFYLLDNVSETMDFEIVSEAEYFRWKDLPKDAEVYYVGGGSKYQSLTALCQQLKDDSAEKIIYLNPGTYDIYAEYRAAGIPTPPDNVTASDYLTRCVFLPPNTSLIGIGNVTLEWSPDKSDITYGEARTWSPLNIRYGCRVENITIHCVRGRYCIHDDSHNSSDDQGVMHYFRDVRCIYEYVADGYGFNNTIGFGVSQRNKVIFDRCTLSMVGSKTSSVFYAHAASSSGGPLSIDDSPELIVRDCVILGGAANANAIRLQSINSELLRVRTIITGTRIEGGLHIQIYSTSRHAFDVTLLNSGSPDIRIDNEAENPYPVDIFDPTIELKEDLTQLSGRTATLETALLGVDAAITRLEAAI